MGIARQFLKQQEFQRQQKLQLLAQQAKQIYLDQQNKVNQAPQTNANGAAFWQKNPHSHQYRAQNVNGMQSNNKKPGRRRKKKRKKKKKNGMSPQLNGQNHVMPEGNLGNMASIPNMPNINITNLMHTNAANSLSPPGFDVFNPNGISHPNGINQQNGINHQNGINGISQNGIQYQQYNPAQFPNIAAQNQSNQNALNPNAR